MLPFIAFEHLTKSYAEGELQRKVLVNASLHITQGETIALLGRSGSGKSTLLNLLSGIETPDEGDVVIGGTHLHQLSEHDRTMFRREKIGFVFQFFNLIPTLTVEENIYLPLELNGKTSAAEKQEAMNLLEYMGLQDRASSFPDLLSGGEQQRVAIVRALAHKPIVLLADEPTGNLDTTTGALVLQLLLDLTEKNGTTLIMATHSAENAALLQRTIRVENGIILEENTKENKLL